MFDQPAAESSSRPSPARNPFKGTPPMRGHDAVLGAIRKDGREVTVIMGSGVTVKGTLVASDQFSLSVNDGSRTRVIFKHAIDEFSAVSK